MLRRALFLVNGLGLGNSTRCAAVISRLINLDFSVNVVTSANGLWYFKHRLPEIRVHEIKDLQYGDSGGKLDIGTTLGTIPDLIRLTRQNHKKIRNLIAELRPDVVITDSTYVFRIGKDRDFPIVALNNADAVVREYSLFKDTPIKTLPQFLCVEWMDYLYHKIFVDYVVSPSIVPPAQPPSAYTKAVGPIVRPQFIKRAKNVGGRRGRVVVMLSGSKFGSIIRFSRSSFDFDIDVIGRPAPTDSAQTPGLRYHGKIADTYDLAVAADLMVVNGGFSAVSEAVMLKIPVIVIPVPNHAEQWVNARTVVDLKIGTISTEENIETTMLAAWERLEEFHQGYAKLGQLHDGAEQAAAFISEITKPVAR
jgi:UDP:flavonoid glycosyltransferase YjiC (YdhE family)